PIGKRATPCRSIPRRRPRSGRVGSQQRAWQRIFRPQRQTACRRWSDSGGTRFRAAVRRQRGRNAGSAFLRHASCDRRSDNRQRSLGCRGSQSNAWQRPRSAALVNCTIESVIVSSGDCAAPHELFGGSAVLAKRRFESSLPSGQMRWTSGVRPFAPFNQSALERHPHHEVIKTFRYVVTLHAMLQRGTPAVESQLLDTRRAFDSVAVDYDGPRGNNVLIQRMRRALWNVVRDELPPGSRLLDLGCGTGIDAAEFARCGYRVTATDWSPRMVERTRALAAHAATCSRIDARHLGIHQLDQIEGKFDGIYSDLGPLNCVPDLEAAAAECARLLRPGGMNRHTIWTRYYLPREFYRVFAEYFSLCGYRALGLFMPPPYLVDYYRRHQRWCDWLGRLDDRLGAAPLLRGMGDHFLIVMSARSRP